MTKINRYYRGNIQVVYLYWGVYYELCYGVERVSWLLRFFSCVKLYHNKSTSIRVIVVHHMYHLLYLDNLLSLVLSVFKDRKI